MKLDMQLFKDKISNLTEYQYKLIKIKCLPCKFYYERSKEYEFTSPK